MNKEEQLNALKSEIENTLKKWQEEANVLETGFIGSAMLESDTQKGYHFMQCICGKSSLIISNALATIERLPQRLKKAYSIEILEALMSVDEEVEHQYSK